MNDYFYALDEMIKNPTSNAPALDAHIYDCDALTKEEVLSIVVDSLYRQNLRMSEMGVFEYDRAIISSKEIIAKIQATIEFLHHVGRCVSDESVQTTIYILIKRIDGRDIIKPPYSKQRLRHFTWVEYFLELAAKKNPGNIIIEAPFLQTRLENVKI